MIKAYKEYWSHITLMNATATRGQYWWPQLINFLILGLYSTISGVNEYIDFMPDSSDIVTEWNVVTILFVALTLFIWVANFTVRARRFHDRDHSNWWVLFYFIPIIGSIVVFVTLILPSKSETRWSANQSGL